MPPSDLQAIVSLQETLSELTVAEQTLNSIPDWMKELHEEHSGRKASIDEVAAQKAEAEKEHRRAEAEATDAQEKLKHYQEQIGKVSTQREYGALLKEIDTVKDQISEGEQQALQALEEVEQARERLVQLEDEFQDLDQRYKTELAKWEAEKPGVAERAEALRGRVEELRGSLHRRWVSLFDRIYDRSGQLAVARIGALAPKPKKGSNTMWHCEACNYNVRPQVVVQIREGAIVQCEGCKRILFWQEEPTEDDAES